MISSKLDLDLGQCRWGVEGGASRVAPPEERTLPWQTVGPTSRLRSAIQSGADTLLF